MFRVLCCLLLVLGIVLGVSAQGGPTSQPTVWATRPDAAAFEKIVNDRLAAGQSYIDKMLAVKGSWTIENTLVPYDESVREVNTGGYLANMMFQVHPDAAFRDLATKMLQKATAFQTAVSLNHDVYNALAALDVSKSDAATRYYVQRQLLEFRLAGVDKDDATRGKLKQLNDQLIEEQSAFDRNISDDQKIVPAEAAELVGLPQDYIERHKPGPDGKVQISTNYPDSLPALKFAKSDGFRHRVFEAMQTRAFPKNLDVLKNMMQTRYEIATLLGYPSWADYFAADKMVVKGGKIADFIQQVDAAGRPVVSREFEMLLTEKRRTDPQAKEVGDYEVSYLSEQVRRSEYNFDSQLVRPYLPYDRVKQGILDTAAKLFRVSFRQEQNVSAWDASVETWDMIDNGKMMGRFYLDMHPRPGKFSHAEMDPVLDGVRGKQLPEAILICNFPKPTDTDPGLMEYGDVVTFFHEFGHLMHWILGGQQPWAGISGITMEADFGEAPSQMLEEWMRSPQVLGSFAHHYKTGEPIPADLVARMDRASAFGRAVWVSQQNSYTAISYDVYRTKPDDVDPDEVATTDEKKYTPFTPLPGT